MKVYRMEDRYGNGPWGARTAGRRDFRGNTLPTPMDDNIANLPESPGRNIRCGVKSPADLRLWFDREDRAVLKHAGAKIAVYEAPDDAVWIGGHQVVFDREKSQRVAEHCPLVALKEIA